MPTQTTTVLTQHGANVADLLQKDTNRKQIGQDLQDIKAAVEQTCQAARDNITTTKTQAEANIRAIYNTYGAIVNVRTVQNVSDIVAAQASEGDTITLTDPLTEGGTEYTIIYHTNYIYVCNEE